MKHQCGEEKKKLAKLWLQILALDYWSIHWKFSIFDTVIKNTSSIQYLFSFVITNSFLLYFCEQLILLNIALTFADNKLQLGKII